MLQEVLAYLIIFFTNIIQALTGFAGTMLAMPPMSLLVGVPSAKAILNVMGLIACLWIAVKDPASINLRELFKITALMFLGMFVGLVLFQLAPLPILLNIYAILILLIALKKLFIKRDLVIPPHFLLFIIFIAGIIHGMFVSGGALLVVYAATALKDKAQFRATLAPVWVLLNSFLLFDHIRLGYFTSEVIRMTLLSIIPLIAAIWVGNKIYNRINQKTFLQITYVLLLISGSLLLL